MATLSLRLMGQERVRERALLRAMSLPDDDPLCLRAESIADHLTPHLPDWQKLFTELLQAQDAQAARALLQRQASAPNPA